MTSVQLDSNNNATCASLMPLFPTEIQEKMASCTGQITIGLWAVNILMNMNYYPIKTNIHTNCDLSVLY